MNQQSGDGSDGGAQVVLADVRDDDLSVDEVVAAVRHPRAGGIAMFVGVVRDHDHGARGGRPRLLRAPQRAETRCARWPRRSPPATRSSPSRRCTGSGTSRSATSRWSSRSAPPHRGAAFEACRELIDTLKATRADLEAPAVQRRLRRVGGAAVTDAPGPSTGMSRRTGGWLVALFVGVALAALLSLIHLPYAILKPGPVTNTLGEVTANKPLIQVSDARTYPTSGVLDFTTVAVYGGPQHPVNVWDVLGGLVDHSAHVVPEQTMYEVGGSAGIFLGDVGDGSELVRMEQAVGDADAHHEEWQCLAFAVLAADHSGAVPLRVHAPPAEVCAQPFGRDGIEAFAGELADVVEPFPGILFPLQPLDPLCFRFCRCSCHRIFGHKKTHRQ